MLIEITTSAVITKNEQILNMVLKLIDWAVTICHMLGVQLSSTWASYVVFQTGDPLDGHFYFV